MFDASSAYPAVTLRLLNRGGEREEAEANVMEK